MIAETDIHERVSELADAITIYASIYSSHPDPVARIHSMMMAIELEIFNRMKAINQDMRHSYDG
jgi:hypothetical protein